MNIGNLKTNEEGIFVGRITTLAFSATVALREFTSNNDKAPAFDIMALSADRRSWVKVGALWQYASNETGEMFLSGRIDDPSLEKPLDVALFNQDDGSYNVAWRRPKAKRTLPTATNDENSLPSLPGFGEDAQEQRPTGDGLGESTYGAGQQQAA
ncbi:MAG: DUF736 domain-containing protein [Pseudomonadota bacterium]